MNYNYEGPLPDPEYYGVKWFTKKRQTEFWSWYNEQIGKSYVFNFERELVAYCKEDVRTLKMCCEEFRRIFVEKTTVDPFQATTIASACNRVFRTKFLEPNTIAIIPPSGYVNSDRQSYVATHWLLWEQSKRNVKIRMARNAREFKIDGSRVKLDGVELDTTGKPT